MREWFESHCKLDILWEDNLGEVDDLAVKSCDCALIYDVDLEWVTQFKCASQTSMHSQATVYFQSYGVSCCICGVWCLYLQFLRCHSHESDTEELRVVISHKFQRRIGTTRTLYCICPHRRKGPWFCRAIECVVVDFGRTVRGPSRSVPDNGRYQSVLREDRDFLQAEGSISIACRDYSDFTSSLIIAIEYLVLIITLFYYAAVLIVGIVKWNNLCRIE